MPLITRNSQNANVKLGTTAQLAAITFTDGDLASDTTLNKLKIFDGSTLQDVGATSFSSSAVVSQSTTIGNYTTPSAAVASSPVQATIEYLVVGGGAGGGGGNTGGFGSGGGGAGGYLAGSGHTITAQTYTITVGTGAAGATSTNGGNSVFSSFTAYGGGYGGAGNTGTGGSGGSGGGGGQTSDTHGTGTSGQGYDGGGNSVGANAGSGGGGSSSAGGGAVNSGTTNLGGTGTINSITGSPVTYSEGGRGGTHSGGGYPTAAPVTGVGHGGEGGAGATAGQNGIVVLKYLSSQVTATGGTIVTSGLYKIHTFTSSGSFIVSSAQSDISGLAIDNNTATVWTSSTEANPKIYVDMGAAYNLCAAAFYFDGTSTTETQIKIQTSADASTWTDKRTITTSNLTNGAYNYYRFNIAGGGRYVRFYGNSGSSLVLSIYEIKILKKTDAEIFNDLGILTITASDTTLGPDGT